MRIGDRIKAERQQRGWTQRELGQRAGISEAYIALLEQNKRPTPSAATLQKLAGALDTSMERLMEGPPPPDTTEPPIELFRAVYSPERVRRIVELWPRLSIKTRLEVITIAEDMKRRTDEGNARTEGLLYAHPPTIRPAFDQ